MKKCKIRYLPTTRFYDRFRCLVYVVMTCLSILGAEYTWMKSEFPKYRRILSENKWHSHTELRLNLTQDFEVSAFSFSVFCICSAQVIRYVLSHFGLVARCPNSPYLFTILFPTLLLEHFPELLNLYCIINTFSKTGPQCFNQSLFLTPPKLSLSVYVFSVLCVPQVCILHPFIPFFLKFCINYSL